MVGGLTKEYDKGEATRYSQLFVEYSKKMAIHEAVLPKRMAEQNLVPQNRHWHKAGLSCNTVIVSKEHLNCLCTRGVYLQ